MTTEEIQWIVENLFVGNRLSTNRAQIELGRNIDLKQIQAPVICFASRGVDNITLAGPGAELDPRHLCRRARDRDPRPAHPLHGV